MIPILFLVALIVALIAGAIWIDGLSGYKYDGWVATCIIGAVVVAIVLIVSVVAQAATFSQSNQLEAFYYDNLSAYEYTVDDAGRIVIAVTENNGGVVTDFTNRIESDRLAELRDAAVNYNADLRNLRAWGDLPMVGWLFVSQPDDELQPIIFQAGP